MPKKTNRNGSIDTNPFGTKTMKRLSLEELKAQKVSVIANLDAIKGGDAAACHGCQAPNCPDGAPGTHGGHCPK